MRSIPATSFVRRPPRGSLPKSYDLMRRRLSWVPIHRNPHTSRTPPFAELRTNLASSQRKAPRHREAFVLPAEAVGQCFSPAVASLASASAITCSALSYASSLSPASFHIFRPRSSC